MFHLNGECDLRTDGNKIIIQNLEKKINPPAMRIEKIIGE